MNTRYCIGITNSAGDNWKIQQDPSRPNYCVVVETEEEAQRWLNDNGIETPNGWKLCERNMYVEEDGRRNFERMRADTNARIEEKRAEGDKIRCPRCKSEQVHAGMRGFNVLVGFIGSGSTVITCLKCGHRFKPGQGA